MRYFEYRTTVSFAETNVVGNVYFANYFVWQGKCREMFLCQYAPQVLQAFQTGNGMITKDATCVFHREAFAFEKILVRMGLEKLTRTSVTMVFQYFREEESGVLTLLAEGLQTAMWVNREHRIAMFPGYLYEAIRNFATGLTDEPQLATLHGGSTVPA